ncbi:MAG: response regulator transcription factor [Chloroflexi bacterium]|nr:response regulator transcription factor [Chloroflexota bacterium]
MVEERAKGIRVFLADDHTVVRRGIARIVQGEADMEVVGEAGDGREAVKAVQRLRPDVVLMDVGMPDLSGIDATRLIVDAVPDSRVLILTVYDQEDILFRAIQAGAAGYVLKGATVDELLGAIRTVYAGEVFLYPRMTARLVRDYIVRVHGGEAPDEYEKLSPREREVLPLLADGRTNQEIAEQLHVSPYTVQTYCQRIMEKLNLHSRTELLKYALRKGLLRLDS